MIENLLLAASVITALTIIAGLAIRLSKLVKVVLVDFEYANYCRQWTLRQAVVNPTFPLDERIEAGEVYMQHGGNGYVKHYVEALLEKEEHVAHDEAAETL
ncbi:MAG: hypothetical protein RSB04_10325 [Gordonibacter sp.]|uniref:hypothetical protein n=1 Tax=Gordonibacter sp. TaxID=1968902 RepID=UPI002FC9A1DB